MLWNEAADRARSLQAAVPRCSRVLGASPKFATLTEHSRFKEWSGERERELVSLSTPLSRFERVSRECRTGVDEGRRRALLGRLLFETRDRVVQHARNVEHPREILRTSQVLERETRRVLEAHKVRVF